MRIHEILDECVDYLAIEGVIGCEPRILQRHLVKSYPYIDETYFLHLYRLLIALPSIQIVLTAHPLPPPEGEILVGTAPVPADGGPHAATSSSVTLDDLVSEGYRGRELAYHIAGKDFQSSRDVIEANREKYRTAPKKKRRRLEGEDGDEASADLAQDELWRIIEGDDGEEVPMPITELAGLTQRWGSRLRLRATDDEIYFRLVGSHSRNPKITGIVFHVLQLAARSREKGISAIDLGPAVGTSQGSLHYYMKVLTTMGLCAKVPTVIYSAVTNVLVYHRFLDSNENYRGLFAHLNAEDQPKTTTSNTYDGLIDPALDEEDQIEEDLADAESTNVGWDIDFPLLSEDELAVGNVVKERLMYLLDHPNLKNHLLKARNLLQVLGWQGSSKLRHRRAVNRHINTLIHHGVLEKLPIGQGALNCFRLTKYNPDVTPDQLSSKPSETLDNLYHQDFRESVVDDDQILTTHREPFQFNGTAAGSRTLEQQILQAVADSGTEGMTIALLRELLSGYYKRSVEYLLTRADGAVTLPHLGQYGIATIMESFGRERRLRAFSVTAFREVLLAQGQTLDSVKYPMNPPEAGHWADIRFRKLYQTITDLARAEDKYMSSLSKIQITLGPPQARRRIRSGPRPPRAPKQEVMVDVIGSVSTPATGIAVASPHIRQRSDSVDSLLGMGKQRAYKYDNGEQIRGRPRKYIHVVEEDGKVNRRVIGLVLPHPDLARVYIWVESIRKLVPAPEGYTGVGPPPKLSNAALSKGKTPRFFEKYPSAKSLKKSKKVGKNKQRKKDGEEAGEGEEGTHRKKGKSKKRQREEEDLGSHPGERQGEIGPSSAGHPKRFRAQPSTLDRIRDRLRQEEASQSHSANSASPPLFSDTTALAAAEEVQGQSEMPQSVSPPTRPTWATAPPETPARHEHMEQFDEIATVTPDPTAPQLVTKAKETSVRRPSASKKSRTKGSALVEAAKATDRKPDILSSSGPTDPFHPSASDPASNLAIPEPLPRVPSPMIGEGYESSDPIFTVPDVELRENAFVLPPHIRTFKQKLARKEDRSPGSVARLSSSAEPMTPGPSHVLPSSPPFSSPMDLRQPLATAQLDTAETPVSFIHGIQASRRQATNEVVDDSPPTEGVQPFFDTLLNVETSEVASTELGTSSADPAPSQDPTRQTQPTRPEPSIPTPAPVVFATPEPTRARIMESVQALPAPSVASEGTPLREIKTDVQINRATQSTRYGRFDISAIRRQNELLESLKDGGGVLTDHKLHRQHEDWSAKVVGTDAPFAPAIVASMDRTVFRRALKALQDQGHIKETIATIPTTTGRWIKASIIYLIDTPWDQVQAYIRVQGSTIIDAFTPKRTARTSIAPTQYTEVRVTPRSSSTRKTPRSTPRKGSQATAEGGNETLDLSPSDRRAALLQDPNIVAALYGFVSGRSIRSSILHRALVRVFEENKESSSIVSLNAPRIFALPLLVEELTLGEWFSIVQIPTLDEGLVRLLQDPASRQMRMRELPSSVKITGTGAGYGAKWKYRLLLDALVALDVLEPLLPALDGEATLTCTGEYRGEYSAFKRIQTVSSASYFRLYDFVPVYHIAANTSSLLGVLPVKTVEQVDAFWDNVKRASLIRDLNDIPRVRSSIPMVATQTAPLKEVLELEPNMSKMFRAHGRWRDDMRLDPAQRMALDDTVNEQTGETTLITDEQFQTFAWEYAMRVETAKRYLASRKHVVKRNKEVRVDKVSKAKKRKEEAEAAKKKAEESLQQKLQERRAAQKAEWEARVKAAAERSSVPFSEALVAFVGRHIVQTVAIASSKSKLSDAALDAACRLFVRNQKIGSMAAPEQLKLAPSRKVPLVKRREIAKKVPPIARVSRDGVKLTRRRRKWDREDDDMLLDSEAIIRHRALNNHNARGRPAMVQVFPDVGPQTLLQRFRKVVAMPGKQAYYDRLFDAWSDVWEKHKAELPDPNPDSFTEFDLPLYLSFLRSHVHKTTVRMNAAAGVTLRREKVQDLPYDVFLVHQEHNWTYKEVNNSSLETFWTFQISDDIRSLTVHSTSIVDPNRVSETIDLEQGDLRDGKLRAVLKMIVGTPLESYHQPTATKLLDEFSPDDALAMASTMASERIFRKNHTLAENSRQYSFVKEWLQLADGQVAEDVKRDAASMSQRFRDEEAFTWNVTGTGGDIAALLDAVSKDQVALDFDLDEFPTLHQDLGSYNTRRLNDIDFEFPLQVRTLASPEVDAEDIHGVQPSAGPVEWTNSSDLAPDATLEKEILELAKAAGSIGVTRESLGTELRVGDSEIYSALAHISATKQIFWAGYDLPRAVAFEYQSNWKVKALQRSKSAGEATPPQRVEVAPRRWLDVFGDRMDEEWDRIVLGIIGLITMRSGLTERALRGKIGTYLDRLEVNDVLQFLLASKKAERKIMPGMEGTMLPPVEATTDEEAALVIWAPLSGTLWRGR